MTRLVFAFMQAYGEDERESLLLARSLRTFGGKLAGHPLWLMMPQTLDQVEESTLKALREVDVQVHRFNAPEEALKFPFGGKVYAAAAAEALASSKTDILVWMDSDIVFAGEPVNLTLDETVSLGYRPVMLKNISALYDEPLDGFWDVIYKQCKTPSERVFPMLTTVDRVRIRPHFNAGIQSVRPEKGLLQAWQENFERLYQHTELVPYYQKHVLYRIFVHQAVLAGTVLALLDKTETRDLGPGINHPMFLDVDPTLGYEATTLRYDEFSFFENPGWEKKVNLKEPFRSWLQAQITS